MYKYLFINYNKKHYISIEIHISQNHINKKCTIIMILGNGRIKVKVNETQREDDEEEGFHMTKIEIR